MLFEATQSIFSTYAALKDEIDLSPSNPLVNEHLSKLVESLNLCQACGDGHKLASYNELSHLKEKLPPLCGQAEGEMEYFWAEKFLRNAHFTPQILKTFWYYDHYKDVVQAEDAILAKEDNLAFIGSGPLPMTVFIGALLNPKRQYICVDWDKEACLIAQKLAYKLNLSQQITFIHADAAFYIPPVGYTPLIASLIDDKETLYSLYEQAPHIQQFMVRDAEEAYCFLYKTAPTPQSHWQEIAKTPLVGSRINTTRLYRFLS